MLIYETWHRKINKCLQWLSTKYIHCIFHFRISNSYQHLEFNSIYKISICPQLFRTTCLYKLSFISNIWHWFKYMKGHFKQRLSVFSNSYFLFQAGMQFSLVVNCKVVVNCIIGCDSFLYSINPWPLSLESLPCGRLDFQVVIIEECS